MDPWVMAFAALVVGLLAGMFLIPRRNGVSRRELEKAREVNAASQARLDTLNVQLQELRRAYEAASAALTESKETIAALSTERKLQEDRLSEREALFQQMQLQFENLAGKILEKNSAKLTEQSKLSMDEALKPFKDRFIEFQNKVNESFGTHAKEQHLLKDSIKAIVETNQKMQIQAENLTRALKGDVKAQGNWGEIMLERILEDAGLRRGLEYVVQGAELGLKHVEDGSSLKPDVIVNLPDGKHIIIDAKVSLTHYERYCTSAGEEDRAINLKLYLNSVRAHVTGLSQRRYQDADKLGTPDFVLMFMPIEGAFSMAIQSDAELHAYAWDRHVVMVCPSTLYATLKTVACLWKVETQNRNAMEIARQGGELYDKIVGFVDDMKNIKKHIGNADSAYDSAMKKLCDGRGSALSRVEHLKKLGAKASKNLPRELLDDEMQAEILPIAESA